MERDESSRLYDRDKSTYLETKLWVLAGESDMSWRLWALCTNFYHL